jgi:hypothetical protein
MNDEPGRQSVRSDRAISASFDGLRRNWADIGREIWNAATRAGQNIQARTQHELEALGRQYMQAEQDRIEQSRFAVDQLAGAGRDLHRAPRAAAPLIRNWSDM